MLNIYKYICFIKISLVYHTVNYENVFSYSGYYYFESRKCEKGYVVNTLKIVRFLTNAELISFMIGSHLLQVAKQQTA